jgi:hypothetical protein
LVFANPSGLSVDFFDFGQVSIWAPISLFCDDGGLWLLLFLLKFFDQSIDLLMLFGVFPDDSLIV